ncbi:Transcriptional regulator GlxA family, contains an amidase domain and an AraC-type DNA-binding HTH domain [Malonomonas rubra DSM 5091]|uniref:Transcriptional regulator GlxA family, contains an amidase domain and an AraC-type DNA-binding HTH domain n=1 Tax=Malonomonas rubra DSM 5091 TaxID=1122189 RepID=A0A1M6K218_MALRU|nr:GlxA family transcriptional regulator [Malonomonas rubra]SHJ52902.1 Transcriptional regulator GlxA family, contains an amidase domain and an AraC-type DNA-binding HTH domain [Malonomonas rubra DSM 5091]
MRKIAVLAYDNCLLSGIAGQLDLFTIANWEQRRRKEPPFCRHEIVALDGEPVTSFNRMPVSANRSLAECQDADLILVPGMMGRPEQLFEQKELIAWLKQQAQRGAIIASACSGAFLLAETGLLKGREATTHWQLADRFRRRYPKITLDIDRLIIDGEDYLCAGGTSAHQDLALYLIEKFASKQLAKACARMMLIDNSKRDQAPFVNFRGSKSHGDAPILKVQQLIDKNFRGKVVVKELALASGLNERTFLRRFRKATGESPLEYVQRMRIEQAKKLLSGSEWQLEQITRTVGYEDVSSFRRLFKQIVGMSPTVYRQRFSAD